MKEHKNVTNNINSDNSNNEKGDRNSMVKEKPVEKLEGNKLKDQTT